MWHIFLRTLKDRKVSLIVYTLTGISFVWMFTVMYPTIQEQSETFQEAFSSYPEGFMAAFGIEEMSFDTLEKFLALENYSIMFPILLLVMVLGLAGGAIASEVEKGTIEHPMSKSVSRLSYFFAKYLLGIFSVVVLAAGTAFSVILWAEIYSLEYQVRAAFLIFVLSTLFGWALYSMAIMFSAFFSEKSKVLMFSGGLVLGMYVLNVASNLIEKVEWMQYLSFFNYYNYNTALIDQSLEWQAVAVFVGTIVVCTVIGALWFKKRDIAV